MNPRRLICCRLMVLCFLTKTVLSDNSICHLSASDDFSAIHYCSSKNIYGSEIEYEFEALQNCHVIEGHLRLHRLTLPENASLPNLTQVTDYIILERVEGLLSLSILFPRLSVIRGHNLFFNLYALVLHGNRRLEEIGPWSMKSIMHGSVRVEDNILLCTENEIHWKNLVGINFRDENFFDNNMEFCPFVGCVEMGYCRAREKTCKTFGLKCSSNNGCDSQCIGGCYNSSDTSSCVACKNFEMDGKCIEECPSTHLNYMNYRCISYEMCNCRNWTVLKPEDTAFLHEGSTLDVSSELSSNKDHIKCIKDCPEKFIKVENEFMRRCKLKQVCETTTITNTNLGDNLRNCTHVDGNLIILVAGGKNVTQRLEENLKSIESVSGYVKVAGANALFSLSFLPNLRAIQGNETIYGGESHEGYSLYIIENSNLRSLFDYTHRSHRIEIKGSVYIHFNDRLCDSEIQMLMNFANISDNRMSNDTNGNNAPCNVFHTHLKAVPGSRNGTILLSWIHNFCGVDYRYIVGYQIFYRAVDRKNVSMYEGRDMCNDAILWMRDIVELEPTKTSVCINYELKCLMPNTRYAIYVESLAVNHIMNMIQSNVVYATTYNDIPEKPYYDGRLTLGENTLSFSWEPPKLKSYFSKMELFYEILIILEDDRITEEVQHSNNSEGREVKSKQSKSKDFCPCNKYSESTYFLQEQKRKSIEIDNEISRIRHTRREMEQSETNSRIKRSSSNTDRVKRSTLDTDERNACGTLQSNQIENDREYRTKACDDGKATFHDCKAPIVDYKYFHYKFKPAITESDWDYKNNILKKSERTKDTNIFINLLPDYALKKKPRKISIQVRSCVGKVEPCSPLNVNESCAICSKFMNWTSHTVDNTTLPDFNVKPEKWTSQTDKPNSNFINSYINCNKFSSDQSTKFNDKTLDDINEETRKMTSKKNISNVGLPVLRITWVEPSSLADFILGYRILYHRIDVSDKQTNRVYINKTEANRRSYRIAIPAESSVEAYWIGFEIRFQGGYGRTNKKCISIPWNEKIDIMVYFGSVIVIGLFFVTLLIMYKFSKGLKLCKEILKENYLPNNYYNSQFRQIEDKYRIKPDELRIYSDESIGKGMFGIVFKGVVTKNGIKTYVAIKAIIGDESLPIIKENENERETTSNKSTEAENSTAVGSIYRLSTIDEKNSNKKNIGNNLKENVNSSLISKKKLTREREEKIKELMDEALIMQKFDSYFVVKLIGVSNQASGIKLKESSLYVALELMTMNFEKYFKMHSQPLEEQHIIEILIQVSDGMSYLHENNYIHRDIAARNILLDQNSSSTTPASFLVKIGDFGLSRNFNDNYVLQSNTYLPFRNAPPESLISSIYNSKSDIWSFGVLIWEFVTHGELPYGKDCDYEEIKKRASRGNLKLKFNDNHSPSAYLTSLMNQSHDRDPDRRPSAKDFVVNLLHKNSQEFQKWFKSVSHVYSSCSSIEDLESSENVDEGCFLTSSWDASQDENDLSTSTPRTFKHCANIETDDDVACLTPKQCSKNRSTNCLTLGRCRKKNISTSDDDDLSLQ